VHGQEQAASQIAAVNLSALSADLGQVGAGIVMDSLTSPLNAIRLSSGYSLPSNLRVYWDMPNKVITVNDGTNTRVQMGLIGSNYGFQIRDADGNLTLDAARSDGRLYLQAGKSVTLAPPVLLLYSATGLSATVSSTAGTVIASLTLEPYTLANDGDVLEIILMGHWTSFSGQAALWARFGTSGSYLFDSRADSTGLGIRDRPFMLHCFLRRTGGSSGVSQSILFRVPGALGDVYLGQTLGTTESWSSSNTLNFYVSGLDNTNSVTIYVDSLIVKYLGKS
jgi:hypothetical protein